MRLDEGHEKVPSKIGSLCTFFMTFLLLAYASYKIDVLTAKKGTNIVQVVEEEYFDGSYVFGAEQGLNIAVGVIDEQEKVYGQIDPSYGKIEFKAFAYGVDRAKNELLTNEVKIESHACSEEELGLSGSNTQFFPIQESQRQLLSLNWGVLRCADKTELQLQGH